MRLLLLDHFDSFTYNVFALFAQWCEVEVIRVDAPIPNAKQVINRYQGVLLSPGPGMPKDYPQTITLVQALKAQNVPLLGICLGHQLLAWIEGANIVPAQRPMHGKTSLIYHRQKHLFQGLPSPIEAMRYHSLIVQQPLPKSLEPLAWTKEQELMAFYHKNRYICGIQFHPESILTPAGKHLALNWIQLIQQL